jgi:hypothetical protein
LYHNNHKKTNLNAPRTKGAEDKEAQRIRRKEEDFKSKCQSSNVKSMLEDQKSKLKTKTGSREEYYLLDFEFWISLGF